LLLVEVGSSPAGPMPTRDFDVAYGAQLPHLLVPTLVLTGTASTTPQACGETLSKLLPRCTTVVVPGAELLFSQSASLQLGHAMMRFLLHCERQRNLVRGASFLL
jgi:hypothetical protein